MALLQGIQEAQKSQKFSRLRPNPNKDEEEEEEGTISELDRGVDELKKMGVSDTWDNVDDYDD